ncbi:hypothetical protein D3C71_2251750 [compost metagenome]
MAIRIERDEGAAEDGSHQLLLDRDFGLAPFRIQPFDLRVVLDHEGDLHPVA